MLCVAHDFPYPPDNGSSVRVLGWLRVLGAAGQVRLVVHPRRSTTPADVAAVEAIPGVELLLGDGPTTPPPRPVAWLRALRRRTPPWFVLWDEPRARVRLDEHLDWATHVLALDDFAAQYLPQLPRRGTQHRALDKHKVYAAPRARGEAPVSLPGRLRDAVLRPLVAGNEARTLDAADTVIVTTAEEDERLRRHHGRRADAVIPGFIDATPPVWQVDPGRGRRFAWLGTADSGPNRAGLIRFLEALARAHHDGRFDGELVLVGKGVDDEVVRHAGPVAVSVAGFVADTTDIIRSCRAAVVPLWAGGGIRLKTLHLLASGIPVVATPTALEGVPTARHGIHCLVGDGPEDLVAQLSRVADDERLAAQLGRRGHALAVGDYTWTAQGPRMLEALAIDTGGPVAVVPGSHPGPGA